MSLAKELKRRAISLRGSATRKKIDPNKGEVAFAEDVGKTLGSAEECERISELLTKRSSEFTKRDVQRLLKLVIRYNGPIALTSFLCSLIDVVDG